MVAETHPLPPGELAFTLNTTTIWLLGNADSDIHFLEGVVEHGYLCECA